MCCLPWSQTGKSLNKAIVGTSRATQQAMCYWEKTFLCPLTCGELNEGFECNNASFSSV